MKRILSILISLGIAVSFHGCGTASPKTSDFDRIKSYRDIPCVTDVEIAAIELLKAEHGSFSCADLMSTEMYVSQNGTYAGFMVGMCDLFTDLFGIEFVVKPYSAWSDLMNDFDQKSVDFMGGLSMTAERMERYHMTHTVAERSLKVFTCTGSAEIASEADIEGLRIGFFPGTVTAVQIQKYYSLYSLSFETVDIDSFAIAVEKLRSGEIDAFVTDSVADIAFEEYGDIGSRELFSLVYSPVSIATANDDLAPVISVINKYLSAGGVDKLYGLYKESDYEYARYKLGKSFTEGERAYLDDLAARGAKVSVGFESDNYPVSFYSRKDQEYQGIAIDVITEISRLTGIQFESAATSDTSWPEILEKLKTGEISMTPQLLYSDARKNDFIWGRAPYASSYYALISKSDYPYLARFQVVRAKVGTIEKTAFEDMYYAWFPDSSNTIGYETQSKGLDALERGDIDLLMASEYLLLTQTNYLEKPGYKINIPFNTPMDSFFGFNKNEEILCSIIDKAQAYVKTDTIEKDWTNRTYDYSKKLANQRAAYLAVFVAVLSAALVLLVILLLKNKRLSKETEDLERHEAESRQAAAIAKEASRMKSIFLANMSHEIRTPMNSIIGFTELALDSSPSPAIQSFLEKIKNSSDILLSVINDILDITKIESGNITLESIPFDMHDLFASCKTIIEPKASERGIQLYCYAEPSIGKKLLGDPARLRQALLNLLSNAVKFTDNGIVKLLAAIEENAGDNVTMRFEVKDSGIGMSREQIDAIFEPFMQADKSTTRRYGGTGLGLSITKNIIELMGGRLMVESTLGVGSKFSFVLTFKTIDAGMDDLNSSTPRTIEKPVFKGEVLVCEDNPMNQEVVCEHLSRVGLNTVIAVNGREAVDTALFYMKKGEPFDLIFMDIHMPVMDGLEAARELIKAGNKTPIVALTANVMPEDRQIYKAHGMHDYLAKPFKSEELWDCLLKHLMPIGFNVVKKSEGSGMSEKQRRRLLRNFANDNQTTLEDISSAIEADDIELAHRLAHTLKGAAALIGKSDLQKAAFDVERSLESGKTAVTKEQMQALRAELNALLDQLAQIPDEPPPKAPQQKVPDKETVLAIFDRLDLLLESNDSDSLSLIDDLRAISGTEELIGQIERYDFGPARKTLDNIKKDVEEFS